jgi:ABC-type amino acid transport substrate-binding protein
VVIADAVPPYSWAEGGRYVGLEVDFANALAAALGRPIRFEAVDFGEVFGRIVDGRADLAMAGHHRHPVRARCSSRSASHTSAPACWRSCAGRTRDAIRRR